MDKLDQLHEVLEGHSQLLIIPHSDPDPDAIASSVGLRYLATALFGIEARIKYDGIIGRAENKALVRYLKHPLKRLNHKEINQDIPIALIDTQPGSGNNPLPGNIHASIVIDHHTWRDSSSQARLVDVRPQVGASATILTEYLKAANITIPSSLATALFYGIKSDTMGLSRGASPGDTAAYFFLQPQVDVEALKQIENAQVPVTYFKSLTTAMQATRLYDDLVISYLGTIKYPDLGAEFADLLLRLQGAKWVICMGVYEDESYRFDPAARKLGPAIWCSISSGIWVPRGDMAQWLADKFDLTIQTLTGYQHSLQKSHLSTLKAILRWLENP